MFACYRVDQTSRIKVKFLRDREAGVVAHNSDHFLIDKVMFEGIGWRREQHSPNQCVPQFGILPVRSDEATVSKFPLSFLEGLEGTLDGRLRVVVAGKKVAINGTVVLVVPTSGPSRRRGGGGKRATSCLIPPRKLLL